VSDRTPLRGSPRYGAGLSSGNRIGPLNRLVVRDRRTEPIEEASELGELPVGEVIAEALIERGDRVHESEERPVAQWGEFDMVDAAVRGVPASGNEARVSILSSDG
jgi:hypothetical protein